MELRSHDKRSPIGPCPPAAASESTVSVHPPPGHFQQVPYTHSAHSPVLPQYGHPRPVQQPIPYFLDSTQFSKFYTDKLCTLTENPNSAIHALLVITQYFVQWGDVVVECIENHIRRIIPPFKLIAFYLVDAISKNLYEPYARHFGPIVMPLFLDAYAQVDESTKTEMLNMLATWRTSSPNGGELFGSALQFAIEREVFGTDSLSDVTRIPPMQVLGELQSAVTLAIARAGHKLHFAISQAEREMQYDPCNNAVGNRLPVLYQLRKFVGKGVFQDELRQILNQLRSTARHPVQLPTQSHSAEHDMSASPPTTRSQPSYNHDIPGDRVSSHLPLYGMPDTKFPSSPASALSQVSDQPFSARGTLLMPNPKSGCSTHMVDVAAQLSQTNVNGTSGPRPAREDQGSGTAHPPGRSF